MKQYEFGCAHPSMYIPQTKDLRFHFFRPIPPITCLEGDNAAMIAVVQRVTRAGVTVEDPPYNACIGGGFCVLLGVENGDEASDAEWMANKLAHLRIFRDSQDKMNVSLTDNGGEILLISQFTLAGDCSKGNRPSFIRAAAPEIAETLVNAVGDLLQEQHSIPVKRGKFGAMMQIDLVNDGPVTVVIQRD